MRTSTTRNSVESRRKHGEALLDSRLKVEQQARPGNEV
jgi:hypothetical protein